MSTDFVVLASTTGRGGWTVEVEVAAGGAWFEGHFPAHPILPAVAQLALVDRLYRQLDGAGWLTAIERFRLPLPIGPGDRLSVSLARPDAAGRSAFTFRRAGAAVSGGAVVRAGGQPAPRPEPAPPLTGGSTTAPADGGDDRGALDVHALLPHRGPALLVQEVLAHSAAGAICRGAIGAASPFTDARRAATFAVLELAAQTAGVHAVLAKIDAGEAAPEIGYLVRIAGATFTRPSIPAGFPLTARADLAVAGPRLSLYRFRVNLNGHALAHGTLGNFAVKAKG